MRTTIFTLTLCAAMTTTLSAQGSFTLLGTGCAPDGNQISMNHNGVPTIGQSFDLLYSGPSAWGGGLYSYQPHLVIGFGLFFPGLPIPQSLFGGQPLGCEIYTEHSIVTPMALQSQSQYRTSFTLAVPNDPTLFGFSFNTQWVTVYEQCGIVPPCWVGWVGTSEVGIATIG